MQKRCVADSVWTKIRIRYENKIPRKNKRKWTNRGEEEKGEEEVGQTLWRLVRSLIIEQRSIVKEEQTRHCRAEREKEREKERRPQRCELETILENWPANLDTVALSAICRTN